MAMMGGVPDEWKEISPLDDDYYAWKWSQELSPLDDDYIREEYRENEWD